MPGSALAAEVFGEAVAHQNSVDVLAAFPEQASDLLLGQPQPYGLGHQFTLLVPEVGELPQASPDARRRCELVHSTDRPMFQIVASRASISAASMRRCVAYAGTRTARETTG